jgi:hypothetical protein
MPAARQAPYIQLRSDSLCPASPMYQIAIWRSPVATAAATRVPSQTFASWAARALP